MPKACPVCGSRKWRRDAVTGSAVCEDGHVFQDFRSENLVLEAVGHVLQKRSQRRRKGERKAKTDRNADYYHGVEAEYLKVQAIQLLLRCQVQALQKLWNLPDAFEMVIRDLWAYQLALSPLPPLPQPFSRPATPSRNLPAQEKGDDDEQSSSGTERSSSSSKGDDDEDSDEGNEKGDEPDIDPELLAQLSADSDTSDDSGAEVGHDKLHSVGKGGAKWKRRRRLRTSDTVVTLALGMWVLRWPFLFAELESLVNCNDIPYLDFGHTTLVPDEMRKHFNRDVMSTLCPARSPRPDVLFEGTSRFARTLSRHFGVTLPEVNLQPLAWRVISSLGGTPTHYVQSLRMLSLVPPNLSLVPSSLETFTRRARQSRRLPAEELPFGMFDIADNVVEIERAAKNREVCMPELRVAAAWVVGMKIVYGLDEEDRQVMVKSDPAVGMIKGRVWVDELKRRLESGSLKGSRASLEKQDFATMTPTDLDLYLDQCEAVLLRNHSVSNPGPFPLLSSERHAAPISESWSTFHALSQLTPDSIIAAIPPPASARSDRLLPLMPGEKIISYDPEDATGTVPKDYEVVLRAASEVVGVDEGEMARAVRDLERALEKWRRRGEGRSREVSRTRG